MVNPVNNLNISDYNNIKGKAQEAQQGEFERTLEKAIEEKDEKKLKKACSDLEAIFVNMMFKQMRSTVQKSGLMDGGSSEEMFEDMLFEKYTEEASKGQGTGLGDILYKQLAKSMKKESEDNYAK
jgi:peptidoglycan hydrolase FlgJ